MIQWVELVVFTVLFGVVSVMGFLAVALAARPRRSSTSTSGGWAGASSAPGSPGS